MYFLIDYSIRKYKYFESHNKPLKTIESAAFIKRIFLILSQKISTNDSVQVEATTASSEADVLAQLEIKVEVKNGIKKGIA